MFITFEGPEGSGKSTQLRLLAGRLQRHSLRLLTTREPGGVALAEEIRAMVLHRELFPETEAMLFLAARAEHMRSEILPALEQDTIVLCDRFTDSTLAYQGYGLGLELDRLRQLCEFAAVNRTPDLTFLLDVPPSLGLQRRRRARSLDPDRVQDQLRLEMELPPSRRAGEAINKMEDRTPGFHERVYRGYIEEQRRDPDRVQRIDGTRTIRQVHHEIWSITSERLGLSSRRRARTASARQE